MTLPELDAAPDDLRQSVHFSRAIMELVSSAHVVAHSAIYTDKGIKLVESGARIDRRLYERLVQAPLREALDNHLAMQLDMIASKLPARLAAAAAAHRTS